MTFRSKQYQGQATLTSSVLAIGIAIIAITLTVISSNPILEDMKDSNAVEEAINTLNNLDTAIREVSAGGYGATRVVNIQPDRGAYIVDPTTDQLYFEIQTPLEIVASDLGVDIGSVTLTADSNVTVKETMINGTQCWLMQNDYMEACIRKIQQNFDADNINNLTGYWRFNEGTGQFLNDSTDHDNHGLLGGSASSDSNDPTWTSNGINHGALTFDGNDDYVEIDNIVAGKSSVTISQWLKPETLDEDKAFGGNYDQSGDQLLWYDHGENQWKAHFGYTGGDVRPDGGSPEKNKWTHVVAIYDRNKFSKMYVNGNEVGSNSAPDQPLKDLSSRWFIGDSNDGTGDSHNSFDGKIDEVRIYNRSLSAKEVSWLYHQQGNVNYINNSNLLVHYRNNRLGITKTPEMRILVNQSTDLINGTGWTKPVETGKNLGYGRVRAFINNSQQSYNIYHDLLTGSDFLKIEVTS